MPQNLSALTDKLYQNEFRAVLKRRDRGFIWLMAAQWAAAVLLACCYTPATLTAQAQLSAAILVGGALSLPPIALAMWRPGSELTRHVMAVWSEFVLHVLRAPQSVAAETHDWLAVDPNFQNTAHSVPTCMHHDLYPTI